MTKKTKTVSKTETFKTMIQPANLKNQALESATQGLTIAAITFAITIANDFTGLNLPLQYALYAGAGLSGTIIALYYRTKAQLKK